MKKIYISKKLKIMFCMLIPIVALVIFSYYFIFKTTKDINKQDQQYLNEIAVQNSEVIKKIVQLNLDKLQSIANIIGHEENLSSEEIISILNLEAERTSFKRLGYAGVDGLAFSTDNEEFSIKDRDYFNVAISGEVAVSNRLLDKVDNNYINVYAVPLYNLNNIIGVIFATSENQIFSDLLSLPTFGGVGFSHIIKEDGTPIMYTHHNDKVEEFGNFFDEIESTLDSYIIELMKEDMAEGRNGVFTYGKGRSKNIAAYCKVGVNDWYVVSIVPKDVISENTSNLILRNAIFVFLTITVFLVLIVFIAIQNRKTKIKLEQIAYYDDLTGAPTLKKFKIESERYIRDYPDSNFLISRFDVDQFKLINRILGNDIGDIVIKNIVKALDGNTPNTYECYGRLHDDEFIVLHKYNQVEELIVIRDRFLDIFNDLMGKGFNYSVKMISGHYYIETGKFTSINDAVDKANVAHTEAKQIKQEVYVYDDNFVNKLMEKKKIENKMKSALQMGRFKVYLQPKYELKNEKIFGAEALVRWEELDGKIIPPNDFISIFEQNGFIIKLDMYMFEQVCKIIKGWMDNGLKVIPVSVNFSRLHFKNPKFIDQLVIISDHYKIPRKYIEIELTETVIFQNENLLEEILNEMHSVGFTLSMDDFGTGYSSLGLLKNLPVDIIKIDRSFFVNEKDKERTKSVIESVITMAKKLNILTVAEGVEKKEHIEFLREVCCEVVQGYYYSKPIPSEQFLALIQK